MTKPHHAGRYKTAAPRLRKQANANPDQRCWSCGRLLWEHPPHKNGRPAYWTAGHVVDGEVNGQLAPEASVCNMTRGARQGGLTRARNQRMRETVRTALTW